MPIKLESLQSEISKKGARWTAANTPLSALSTEEKKKYLGLAVTKEDLAATREAIKAAEKLQSTLPAKSAAPAAIDWRNNRGNYTTSVKDQGRCNACVSFSIIATIESRMAIACGNRNLNPDYSEAFLFYCGCGQYCCHIGWIFPPALNFCKNTGVANDADFPFTGGDTRCKTGVPIQFKINSWAEVLPVAERKKVIAAKGPVVAGLSIYEDFMSYGSGVYKHVTGGLLGSHAVSVAGYSDAEQCWIAKNSWGTGWGENGWVKIGYGEIGIETNFPFYDINLTCSQPPKPTCDEHLPYLQQIQRAARNDPQLKRCLRAYVCLQPSTQPICSAAHNAIIERLNKIFRDCPQHFQPFCSSLG